MRVYIGWDARDELAFRACVFSLIAHSSIPLEIYPLKDYDLRRMGIYNRPYNVEASGQMFDSKDGRPFSTQFAFTRFCIPLIDNSDDWVMFCDADFLFRRDIKELLSHVDYKMSVMCVKHDYQPKEETKFDGMLQQQYERKNWSSLMLMRPRRCSISKDALNNASGRHLHSFAWVGNDQLGALPAEWNWLEGHSPANIDPAAVHYTRGTPDMLGKLPYDGEWWNAAAGWTPGMNHHLLRP